MKKHVLITIHLLNFIVLKAQENNFCKRPSSKLFANVTNTGWVKFNPGLQLSNTTLFITQKKAFGLEDNYEMKKSKTIKDELGFTHNWYDEYVNNIKVLHGHFILHEKRNELQSGNGKIYTSSTINSTKNISPSSAVKKAIEFVHANKYYWQDTAKENKIKRKFNNASASYYPKPTVLYNYDDSSKQLRLCYEIPIQSVDAGKSGMVYIYADNGLIFLWEPFSHYTCDPTTVNTTWYGNQQIFTYTDAVTAGWDLEDDCTPSTYKVFDYANNNNIFNSANNQWLTPRQRSAATALWSVRKTRDVYSNVFGRNGHDGNGQNFDIYFDYIFPGPRPTENANYTYDFYGDDEMNIGRGTDNPMLGILDDYCALDILAHEFTHGVIQYTCKLSYQRESGALNESFADIFGEFVENNVFGNNNWLLGWDRRMLNTSGIVVNNSLRDMDNPITFSQPDRYFTPALWANASSTCTPIGPGMPGIPNDYCGVHINSGVQNRMFFLLSAGGNGFTNDSSSRNTSATGVNPYEWSVGGIGIDKSARIAYRVISVYLSPNSNYFDSRNAWVHAAEDLFGVCSFEAIQTGKAWYAVGINPPTSVTPVCGEYGAAVYTQTKPGKIDIANDCIVNILPTGNLVQMLSGTEIVIKGNQKFKAAEGSKFRASIIDECSFATY
jgi:bacillolysin